MTGRLLNTGSNSDCLRILSAVAAALFVIAQPGSALDVPLIVREADGIARIHNPVNSGVPLPQGRIQCPTELRLLDAEGEPVLASIEPRARWLDDNSLQWVTVHFVVPELAAGATRNYRLAASKQPAPESPLRIDYDIDGRSIVVETGPARFTVPLDRLAPFRQVHVRADSREPFADDHAMLARPGQVELVARNGRSRIVPHPDRRGNRSETAELDETAFTQSARVHSFAIEERGPGRASIVLEGAFSTKENESLDFTARLYFYARSALAQMTLSVRNRQADDFARFVALDRLTVRTPLDPAENGVVFLATDDDPPQRFSPPVALAQTAMDRFAVRRNDEAIGAGAQSSGWIQSVVPQGGLLAGTRWFWQNYPMGIAQDGDGNVDLHLKEAQGERVDLYTGGAKTHFLFFHFSRNPDIGSAASIAAGTTHPLAAAASPDWYCQGTRAMGDLYSANLDLYEPRYRELVARFQERVDASLKAIVEARPRPDLSIDEYGWLDFGSGLHHNERVFENSAESWWDGNYYDFPHAVLVNYVRTGDPINLRTAEEAGLHLADLDIAHVYPGRPAWTGAPRTGPVVGHFRGYSRGQMYTASASFTFYKNESLYELYWLTGERWYRDVGIMSSDFAMRRWGRGASRNLAHGIWGVLSAYRHTHDRAYLDRARFFVDEWGKPWQDKHAGGFGDQTWMHGLVFEAYEKYFRITRDKETARYLVKAVDAIIAGKGTGGPMCMYGYGLAYEYTGDRAYFDIGMKLLRQSAAADPIGRVKTFAQRFRSAPYFLRTLTRNHEPSAFLAR